MRIFGYLLLTSGFAYTGLANAYGGVGLSHTWDMWLLGLYLGLGWTCISVEYLDDRRKARDG